MFNINAVGRRTGECIVVFENEEQTLLAMKRNKHYLGKRYIEVWKLVHTFDYYIWHTSIASIQDITQTDFDSMM